MLATNPSNNSSTLNWLKITQLFFVIKKSLELAKVLKRLFLFKGNVKSDLTSVGKISFEEIFQEIVFLEV